MSDKRSAQNIPQEKPRRGQLRVARMRPRLALKMGRALRKALPQAGLAAALMALGFCTPIPAPILAPIALAQAGELAGRQAAGVSAGANTAALAEAGSGLAIPRFVSLASDKVNVRVGPGTNYPIRWQFVRRGLPVEVIGEYEFWRQIRDQDGAEGWVHKSLLSSKRTALILGEQPAALYREPDLAAGVVARAKAGAQVRLLSCKDAWCRIEIGGFKGYVLRQTLWGAYADEAID